MGTAADGDALERARGRAIKERGLAASERKRANEDWARADVAPQKWRPFHTSAAQMHERAARLHDDAADLQDLHEEHLSAQRSSPPDQPPM